MDRTRALASFGVALALLACDDKGESASQPTSLAASYQRLSGAFATCDQTLEQCATLAEGDAEALSACGLKYRSCRDEAGDELLKPLAEAIQSCAEEARDCWQNAEFRTEIASCRRQLGSCLADNQGAADDAGERDDDAGTDERGQFGEVVRACVARLRQSVEAGDDAHICARNVRHCIAESTPSPAAQHSDAPANGSVDIRACIDELRSCIRAKRGPRECVETLRQCTHPSTPAHR